MLQNKKQYGSQEGFTIVELLVGVAITTILSIVLVAYMVATLSQTAISSTRSQLSSALQTALTRINDDVRNSSGVMPYSLAIDPNAPSGGEWSTSSTVLILGSKAIKTDGNQYTNTSFAYDSIIYYIKDGSLFKRIVAYQDPDNRNQTATCPGVTTAGGCSSDTLLASNVATLSFVYYTKIGDVTTDPMNVASVRTNATLQTSQSGQSVSYSDGATMTPRVLDKFADNALLTAGLGGMSMSYATINGGPGTSIYSSGGLSIGQSSNVGTATAPISRINVANRSCGTNATFGTSCAPAEPIPTSGSSVAFASLYSDRLCAANQVNGTPGSAYNKLGVTGLVAGCSPNFRFQPVFDKGAHAAKMVAPAVSSIICQKLGPYGCQGPVDIPANKKINGKVDITGGVTVTLRGDSYITGDLTFGDSAPAQTVLMVDQSLTKRPVVVVNGRINFNNFRIESANGVTPIFVSFWSTDSARSQSDSYTTQDPQLIYSTVNMAFGANDAIGLNSNTYAGSFYAYFGRLTTNIGATIDGTVAGQRVQLGYNTTVNLTRDPWNDLN